MWRCIQKREISFLVFSRSNWPGEGGGGASILWRIIYPTFGRICHFRDPNLVTFYLRIYLILNEEHLTFQLRYKNSGTFANPKYEELSYPKNPKMCDPILVTLLKM